jgi:glycerophosphoryl diester phosphodiesterase
VGSMAIQAHRGSPEPAMGIRENTLEAFLRARQLGADGVELDVRMTSDGALAVHHDPIIAGVGPISGLTAGQLPDFVPLLAAALDACHGLTVNVEIKNLPGEPGFDPSDHVTRQVADLVAEGETASSVVISSFWPSSLEAVRDAHPDLATGLLLAPWFDPAESVAAATARGCTAIHPHLDLVDGDLVARAHQAGLAVAVWTVNDRSALEALAAAGADTVITDDVALALATVGGG